VRITGVSAAPIPWPIAQTLPNSRARSLVLYGDLIEAVKRESAGAVMHFWGVKANTLWTWRKALNVGQYTEGTRKCKSESFLPHAARGSEAARPTWGSEERRAKISAARKGKPRPAHVVEAMRKGRTGKPYSEETRAKMCQAQRARQRDDAWTQQQDELVRALPAQEGSGGADGADAGGGVGEAARAEAARRHEAPVSSPRSIVRGAPEVLQQSFGVLDASGVARALRRRSLRG
jgi:hypothetical protein